MKKQIAITILCLCLALGLLAVSALAADAPALSGTCGDHAAWNYDDTTKTLTIRGSGAMCDYNCDPTTNIPNTPWSGLDINNVEIESGVTSIGDSAFSGCSTLSSITIPDGVTSIGDSAFFYCGSLSSIVIPDSVTRIGDSAFSICSNLSGITIPDGVTRIGDSAFFNCSALSSIVIPESVTSIGEFAFYYCSTLSSLTISNGVTSIGDDAFAYCTNLSSITIPDSVTSLGVDAFSYCFNLSHIALPAGLTACGAYPGSDGLSDLLAHINSPFLTSAGPNGSGSYAIEYGWIDAIPEGAFSNLSTLTQVTISDTIEIIGDAAFSGCTQLEELSIPASVTEIGCDAFASCINLKNIRFAGTQAQWDALKIAGGNQELNLATVVCTGTDPGITDDPDSPDSPAVPGTLDMTAVSGGLGLRLMVRVQSGHWLTNQTLRAGSIAISSVQAPSDADGVVTVTFSAPVGSIVQVWETESEMTFVNGVPANPILKTVVKEL